MASTRRPLYVASVRLVNIKCFAEAELRFDHGGETPLTVVVGDNATGKTVILRSLALGLCDQTSAAGLMKESDEGYIRRPERKGLIDLELCDPANPAEVFRITTNLTKVGAGDATFERLEQTTVPSSFPWDRVFACAYGTGRAISGTGDIAGYSVINAVYNLFSYGEGLQNPELSLRRLDDKERTQEWLDHLATLLPVRQSGIHLQRALTFDGRWGVDMPFRDLADGVRGTFLWTADLVGWAIAYDSVIALPSQIRGVVLIDEIEQHLHATWQRDIVSRLRKLFPQIQFIATTHSPIIAASVGNLGRPASRDTLMLCELDEESQRVRIDALESLQTYRFDQVLASKAFKYLIQANEGLESALRRGSELADKGDARDAAEEEEYSSLKNQLAGAEFLRPDTSIEREIDEEEMRRLKDETMKYEQG